jgi:hypothetical protein
MPSDRILEAEGERRRWREAVVSLIEPDLAGLRGEIAEVRAAQQAHETQDSQRHLEVMGALKGVVDRVDRALDHRVERTTDPGDRGEVAAALATLAGRVDALATRPTSGISAGLGALLTAGAGWPWHAWVLIVAAVTGGGAALTAAASAMAPAVIAAAPAVAP